MLCFHLGFGAEGDRLRRQLPDLIAHTFTQARTDTPIAPHLPFGSEVRWLSDTPKPKWAPIDGVMIGRTPRR